MTRRASLPGVDELFRSAKDKAEEPPVEETPSLQIAKEPIPAVSEAEVVQVFEEPDLPPAPATPAPAQERTPEPAPPAVGDGDAGRRPRHDEKVTFYCTASDLTRIERARLSLRADHKLASDRGRIVRAALTEILDDFEGQGADSALVRRLRQDRSS